MMTIKHCTFCGEVMPAPESKGEGYVNHTCDGCGRLWTAFVRGDDGFVIIPCIDGNGVIQSPPSAWQHQDCVNDEPGVRHGIDKRGRTYTAIDPEKVDEVDTSECGQVLKIGVE